MEKDALSGIMKKDYSKNNTISINLNKFQERLDNTKFAGVNLKEIIENYFVKDIISNKESKQKYNDEIKKFFNEVLKEEENTFVYEFLKKVIDDKKAEYLNLKKYYNRDKVALKQALHEACNGINNLPDKNTRTPVFASKILGNPHGLDKKNLSGKIFVMLLSYIDGRKSPKNSEELADLYYKYHLLIDDVSNMILCKNIIGIKDNGQEHNGMKGFSEANEPLYLTIYNLSNIPTVKNDKKYNKVMVMENPAVFMEVAEKCKIKDFPMVCTYGQVKLAGIILLDLLVNAGFKIYYSGDIDPEGMQIADKLKNRYGENLEFFGFDEETYLRNISNVKILGERLNKLKTIENLKDICKNIREIKMVAYEEANIENIIKFVENLQNN